MTLPWHGASSESIRWYESQASLPCAVVCTAVARQHIVEYDIDRSGSIEEAEFIM
jgi:hypothetical protein